MHFISVLGHYEGWPGLPGRDGGPLLPPQTRPHHPRLQKDDGPDLQERKGHPDVRRQDGHRCTLTVYNQMPIHSVCLSVCLSVCHYFSLSFFTLRYDSLHFTFFLSFFLSFCLTVCLPVFLSLCLSVCLSVCLSIHYFFFSWMHY